MINWRKKNWFKLSSVAVAVAFLYLASGCASRMQIKTIPEGANVTVDGQDLGKAPVTYEGTSGLPSSEVTIGATKDGYKPAEKIVKKSELNVGQLVIGILLFTPAILWSWYFPDATTINLEKDTSQKPPNS